MKIVMQCDLHYIGSHDTVGGLGLRNRHRKCVMNADSGAQSQLSFVIEMIDILYAAVQSMADYLAFIDRECHMNQSWDHR